MPFRVIESIRLSGKATDDLCEDRMIATPHFVAVLDGATGSMVVDGKPGGWLAAEIVKGVIESLPADVTVFEFEKAATAALKPMHDRWDGNMYPPCTQAVVYSVARQEIWRIGDCHARIDGVEHVGGKKVDAIAVAIRCMVLRGIKRLGLPADSEAALAAKERHPWRWVSRLQAAYQNRDDDPLCYGVLDGSPVPPKFIDVFDAKGAKEIVLCSDGFYTPTATLAEGLADLKRVKDNDPMQMELVEGYCPFVEGKDIHDDTTYIRLALEP